ncbi:MULTISPECIES: flagella biosynthesis regulatory protein FliT [unclassified Symbiopectobacterium]|uniref:flagella biosynthesis regulatory protein FliT n=1 Tax=unclassified Symbiopectobacterium TaxID=2794573 RepID=UPI0022278A2B|nr:MULTISPECIES: flagella biosynthesis regulatory protein FliT [unclassified Symbiopectobacterium]MCW2474366.1 flagella biosynthesis regulatory protein FliT [Candidatus Symbiopectobacterium sp. NZEC151]MCW2485607.1 flagella biosynthesis regulatory protein FliT [Candidatus Symbiopectobacterium sp. NZEC127]
MTSLQQLLSEYQQLQQLSRSILALATNGLWDEVVEQEIIYIQTVEHLSKTPIPENLDSVIQLQFRKILREIVESEAQIKALLQKRMDELSALMQTSLKQHSVNAAYGEFSPQGIIPGHVNHNNE